ncbi:MAG: hypothetical protein ABJB86_14540 [Bacteroidota bacterium]
MKKITLILSVLLLVGCFSAAAQDTTFKEITGTYKFAAGSVIPEAIVTLENGVLTMTSAEGTSTLEKVKGDTFNVVSFSGIAVFKRNEAKKINGVHIEASGYIFDGVKDGATINGVNFKTDYQAGITNVKLHQATTDTSKELQYCHKTGKKTAIYRRYS